MNTNDPVAKVLFKDYLNVPSNRPTAEWFDEGDPYNNYIIGDQVFIDNVPEDPIFQETTKPAKYNGLTISKYYKDTTNVLEKFEKIKLILVPLRGDVWYQEDTNSENILKNAFQFNYGKNEKFSYELFINGTEISKGTRWLFNYKSGYITFYSNPPPSNANVEFTFVKYIGNVGINNIQTILSDVLNTKQDNITGGATSITTSNLAFNRALVSDGSGKVAVSNISTTQLEHLSGINSNIQNQLNIRQQIPASTTNRINTVQNYSGTTNIQRWEYFRNGGGNISGRTGIILGRYGSSKFFIDNPDTSLRFTYSTADDSDLNSNPTAQHTPTTPTGTYLNDSRYGVVFTTTERFRILDFNMNCQTATTHDIALYRFTSSTAINPTPVGSATLTSVAGNQSFNITAVAGLNGLYEAGKYFLVKTNATPVMRTDPGDYVYPQVINKYLTIDTGAIINSTFTVLENSYNRYYYFFGLRIEIQFRADSIPFSTIPMRLYNDGRLQLGDTSIGSYGFKTLDNAVSYLGVRAEVAYNSEVAGDRIMVGTGENKMGIYQDGHNLQLITTNNGTINLLPNGTGIVDVNGTAKATAFNENGTLLIDKYAPKTKPIIQVENIPDTTGYTEGDLIIVTSTNIIYRLSNSQWVPLSGANDTVITSNSIMFQKQFISKNAKTTQEPLNTLGIGFDISNSQYTHTYVNKLQTINALKITANNLLSDVTYDIYLGVVDGTIYNIPNVSLSPSNLKVLPYYTTIPTSDNLIAHFDCQSSYKNLMGTNIQLTGGILTSSDYRVGYGSLMLPMGMVASISPINTWNTNTWTLVFHYKFVARQNDNNEAIIMYFNETTNRTLTPRNIVILYDEINTKIRFGALSALSDSTVNITNQWATFVVTRSTSTYTLRVYTDNTLRQTITPSDISLTWSDTMSLNFGTYEGSVNESAAFIDDIRIYSSVISTPNDFGIISNKNAEAQSYINLTNQNIIIPEKSNVYCQIRKQTTTETAEMVQVEFTRYKDDNETGEIIHFNKHLYKNQNPIQLSTGINVEGLYNNEIGNINDIEYPSSNYAYIPKNTTFSHLYINTYRPYNTANTFDVKIYEKSTTDILISTKRVTLNPLQYEYGYKRYNTIPSTANLQAYFSCDKTYANAITSSSLKLVGGILTDTDTILGETSLYIPKGTGAVISQRKYSSEFSIMFWYKHVNFSYTPVPDLSDNPYYIVAGLYDMPVYEVEYKFPTGDMTATTTNITTGLIEGQGNYTATASSILSGSYPAWWAFDSITTSGNVGWHSGTFYNSTTGLYTGSNSIGGISGEWLKLELPTEIKVYAFSLLSRTGCSRRTPNTFQLLGSNNDTTWTSIFSQSNYTLYQDNVFQYFTVNNNTGYKYLALVIETTQNSSLVGGGTIGTIQIVEMRYYGIPVNISPTVYLEYDVSNSQLRLSSINSDETITSSSYATSVNLKDWSHISMTRNSNTYKVYVNGAEKISTTFNNISTKLTDRSHSLMFANWSAGLLKASAYMSDIRIYNSNITSYTNYISSNIINTSTPLSIDKFKLDTPLEINANKYIKIEIVPVTAQQLEQQYINIDLIPNIPYNSTFNDSDGIIKFKSIENYQSNFNTYINPRSLSKMNYEIPYVYTHKLKAITNVMIVKVSETNVVDLSYNYILQYGSIDVVGNNYVPTIISEYILNTSIVKSIQHVRSEEVSIREYTTAPPTNNLVFWFKCNSFRNCYINSGHRLDGGLFTTNDFTLETESLVIPRGSSASIHNVTIPAAFSISFLFKYIETAAEDIVCVMRITSNDNTNGLYLLHNRSTNQFILQVGNTSITQSNTTTLSNWNYIVVRSTGTAINVNINGTQILTLTVGQIFTSSTGNNIEFGIYEGGNLTYSSYLSDVRMYNIGNVALTTFNTSNISSRTRYINYTEYKLRNPVAIPNDSIVTIKTSRIGTYTPPFKDTIYSFVYGEEVTNDVLFSLLSTKFYAQSGTAEFPTYSFLDEKNTGMYKSGVNSLGFSVGGQQMVNVDTSGVNVINGTGINVINGTVRATSFNENGTLISSKYRSIKRNILANNSVSLWTGRTPSNSNSWMSVCWSPELGIFCAISYLFGTAANRIMTSPDGITWTARAAPSTNQWRSICWSPELGIFCAVASNIVTGANLIMTSPDGITWTDRVAPTYNAWVSVCWSPELGIFCAVASNIVASTNLIMTSPNGITWTARAPPNYNGWSSVCWSPELGIFCAVARNGGSAANRIMTSPDGITWTARAAPNDNAWVSVCWSPELGIFCAVASNSGTPVNLIMTSPDGITWTARAAPYDNEWSSICWSPDLGIFCAVASNGGTAANRIMTSPDGITWTARAAPYDNAWVSVCWSPELGIFCSVASTGVYMVMTSTYTVPWRTEGNNIIQNGTANVGIGKAPGVQLDLSTDSARKLTTNTWATGSDYRLKTDIEVANYDRCYEIINNLDLKRFAWRTDIPAYANVDDRHKLGWIAQDVETVFPNAIKKSKENGIEDMRSLNVDQIYAVMYGSIKKLITKVENLEKEISILKQEKETQYNKYISNLSETTTYINNKEDLSNNLLDTQNDNIVIPDDNNVIPDNNNVIPDNNNVIPDDNNVIPDDNNVSISITNEDILNKNTKIIK